MEKSLKTKQKVLSAIFNKIQLGETTGNQGFLNRTPGNEFSESVFMQTQFIQNQTYGSPILDQIYIDSWPFEIGF